MDAVHHYPVLEDWRFMISNVCPYTAPEQISSYCTGKIYNDARERFIDGTLIDTSRITAKKGNLIQTHSGTIYTLGTPNQNFIDWLISRGKSINDYKDFGTINY